MNKEILQINNKKDSQINRKKMYNRNSKRKDIRMDIKQMKIAQHHAQSWNRKLKLQQNITHITRMTKIEKTDETKAGKHMK